MNDIQEQILYSKLSGNDLFLSSYDDLLRFDLVTDIKIIGLEEPINRSILSDMSTIDYYYKNNFNTIIKCENHNRIETRMILRKDVNESMRYFTYLKSFSYDFIYNYIINNKLNHIHFNE